ncbi:MAG: hypothetical protein J7647_11270 [Cyanobacteria bacterium SBLK]|nr:hypothetical protein [Cyanobacteria bacterium SBLK]
MSCRCLPELTPSLDDLASDRFVQTLATYFELTQRAIAIAGDLGNNRY